MKNRVYIYDFDGTICDLIIDWTEWHKGLGNIYREFVPDFDLDLKGQKVHDFQNIYIKQFGEILRKKIADYNAEYESRMITDYHPHTGIIEVITNMSDTKKYLWTANSKKTIEKYLPLLGLEHAFSKLITRDDVTYIKPDPQGFDLISIENPSETDYLFIGDSPHDEQAAKSAKINFRYVTSS
jgi:HAD superfamily hydrolase (TIGR01549 family)